MISESCGWKEPLLSRSRTTNLAHNKIAGWVAGDKPSEAALLIARRPVHLWVRVRNLGALLICLIRCRGSGCSGLLCLTVRRAGTRRGTGRASCEDNQQSREEGVCHRRFRKRKLHITTSQRLGIVEALAAPRVASRHVRHRRSTHLQVPSPSSLIENQHAVWPPSGGRLRFQAKRGREDASNKRSLR
jgi:hypothetical protein